VFALASWQKRIALGFCRRVTGKRAKICGRARGQVMKPIKLVGWAICASLALAGCGDGKRGCHAPAVDGDAADVEKDGPHYYEG